MRDAYVAEVRTAGSGVDPLVGFHLFTTSKEIGKTGGSTSLTASQTTFLDKPTSNMGQGCVAKGCGPRGVVPFANPQCNAHDSLSGVFCNQLIFMPEKPSKCTFDSQTKASKRQSFFLYLAPSGGCHCFLACLAYQWG